MLAERIGRNCRRVEGVFEDLRRHLNRYVKVPAAASKRLGGSRDPKQVSAPAKAPWPAPAVKCARSIESSRLEDDNTIDERSPAAEAKTPGRGIDSSEQAICDAPHAFPLKAIGP